MLDFYEGYPKYYGRHYVLVETENGETEKAIVYEMNIENKAPYSPSKDYFECIKDGYKEFGLDYKYLNDAVAEVGIDNSITEVYYRHKE